MLSVAVLISFSCMPTAFKVSRILLMKLEFENNVDCADVFVVSTLVEAVIWTVAVIEFLVVSEMEIIF